jgi:hypothetical protein
LWLQIVNNVVTIVNALSGEAASFSGDGHEIASPSGQLTFAFERFQQTHYFSDDKAYLPFSFGWDFVDGHEVSLASPHADLLDLII